MAITLIEQRLKGFFGGSKLCKILKQKINKTCDLWYGLCGYHRCKIREKA